MLELYFERSEAEPVSKSNPVLFLLNGYTRTVQDFKSMVRFLNQRGVTTVAIDLPGAGKSTTSVSPLEARQAFYQQLQPMLEKEDKPPFMLGISMGGVLAQHFLLGEGTPQRPALQGLILVSTTYATHLVQPSHFGGDQGQNMEQVKRYVSEKFFTKNALLLQSMAKMITKSFASPSGFDQRQMIRGLDMQRDLQQLKMPCLILHGKQDEIIPHSVAETMHAEIPDSRLISFAEDGHLLIAENPQVLYQEIARFVGAVF